MKKLSIFFPIRLNSQRLPNELLLLLKDKTFIEIMCEKLDRITDYDIYVLSPLDGEVLSIIKKYKNINVVIRDDDTCNVDGTLRYIYKELQEVKCTHLMFINGCLYNLPLETILKSCKKFVESDKQYATSVKHFRNWLWEGNKPITDINYLELNTKNINNLYQCAHCFHIFNKEEFFKTGKMLNEDLQLIEVPDIETLDVDTRDDYEYAKYYVQNSLTKK